MNRLENKVAVITGAASGIGRASAKLFAREGAAVVVADISEENGESTVTEIRQAAGTASFVRTDVSQPDSVSDLISYTVSTFGRIDVLFNNAAVQGAIAPTAECSLENWQRVIAANLTGVFAGMHYAIPHMIGNGGGSIINTASIDGIEGRPGFPGYCASKGGVVLLTKAAALEYARMGIRINCICPGGIWTGMARAFATDSESSFCTGATFFADGGVTAGPAAGT